MEWLILFLAGLFEIGWAIGLKYTEGFSRLVPSVLTVGAMVISIVLLGVALKTLPVGTAYAVWTGNRRGRHRGARHLPVRRAGHRGAPRLDRADRRGHRRVEARDLNAHA